MHRLKYGRGKKVPLFVTMGVLAIITFIAHFWYFQYFGIYEDDWIRVPIMFQSWDEIGIKIIKYIYKWPEGRPLHFILPIMIGGLNAKLGGLPGIYLGGYLIVLANVWLFYYLVKRFLPSISAIIGALTFCLFPADTTKLYPIFFHSLQTSLFFLLSATYSYLTGRQILSYFIICFALLTYETTFWPFVVVPLLSLQWDKASFRQLLKHVLILIVIFTLLTIFRIYLGEARATGLLNSPDLWERLGKNLMALGVGPLVSLYLTFYRTKTAILGMSFDIGLLVTVVFFLCLFLLWYEPLTKTSSEIDSISNKIGSKTISSQELIPEKYLKPLKIGLLSLVILSFSYLLSFLHFPLDIYSFSGHKSGSTHMAATFGMGLLVSSISTIMIVWAQAHYKKYLVILALAIYFSLLAGFHIIVQEDFVRGWVSQQQFWSRVLKLCPDVSEGTTIFVENHGGLLYLDHILLNSWNQQIILEKIYHLPQDWENPPRLFTVEKDWKNKSFKQDNYIMWGEVNEWIFDTKWIKLQPRNVILLIATPNGLYRIQKPIILCGRIFPLKVLGEDNIKDFKRTAVYDLLIMN